MLARALEKRSVPIFMEARRSRFPSRAWHRIIESMTHRSERALTLTCVADQSAPAAALHEALVAIFPSATITRVDTDVEQFEPEDVDCAVVDASVNGVDGVDVVRRIRARGF